MRVSVKRGMPAPSCRPRLRAGCITGEGRSHGGKSGVRGIAMTGKQEGVEKKKKECVFLEFETAVKRGEYF